jgi:lipopolysaccharide transport system ATP-binding protein
MSDTVIRVENLGKKYVLGQQKSERYTTLRDTLANGSKNLLNAFGGCGMGKRSRGSFGC